MSSLQEIFFFLVAKRRSQHDIPSQETAMDGVMVSREETQSKEFIIKLDSPGSFKISMSDSMSMMTSAAEVRERDTLLKRIAHVNPIESESLLLVLNCIFFS
jgi:hypothetical protein